MQSIFYDETVLVDKAHAFIETRTEEVLKSPSFTEISCATLIRILKFDKLTVTELELFQVGKCRKNPFRFSMRSKYGIGKQFTFYINDLFEARGMFTRNKIRPLILTDKNGLHGNKWG